MSLDMEFISDQMVICLQSINAQLPADSMAHFKKLTTDEDRFLFTWHLACVHDVLQSEPEYNEKTTIEAVKHRNQGNAYFQKKSYMTAVDEYNKSIRYAPVKLGKQELALAYGNRSAALLHLKRYELSLRDSEMALDHGYPEDLQYKLYDRKGKCYLQLNKISDATTSFRRAITSLPSAKLDDVAREKWKETINNQIRKAEAAQGDEQTPSENGVQADCPVLPAPPNTVYRNASSAVSIVWESYQGRHAVASKDISVGDVLVVEKPYASVLLPEFYDSHCYNCFRRVLAPVACTQCTTVVFCSQQCQTNCWEHFHQYECHCMALLGKNWCASIGHLALRVVMVIGWQQLLQYKRDCKMGDIIKPGDEELQGVNSSGIYADDYHSVFNLVTNANRRMADGLFDFTVFSVFLMKVLQMSKFLPDGDNVLTEKRLCLMGGVLLKHLQILQCNVCGIREMLHPSDFHDLKPVNIGCGLYPTAALFNHSCDANSDFVYYNNSLTTRATRNIRKGEEITCDYGPCFFNNQLRERRAILNFRYSFECKCCACANKWPLWSELNDHIPVFQCGDCQARLPTFDLAKKKVVKCKSCQSTQDLGEVVGQLQASHDIYSKGMESALGGNTEDALPNLIHHLMLLQRHTRMPWRDTVACQQAVRNCYRLLGNIRC